MKLTIDIPEEVYQDAKNNRRYMPLYRFETVWNAIADGKPQESIKGHWEHGRELSRVFIGDALRGINYEDWHCSNCHCVIEQSIKPKWNYCPNCGTDMREVEE